MAANPLSLYRTFFSDRGMERTEMFALLAERFAVKQALYPGCFVHISPSFVIPSVTYVDSDKQARRFFASSAPLDLIMEHRHYAEEPRVRFEGVDYSGDLDIEDQAFDLLISQFAGLVSQACKR